MTAALPATPTGPSGAGDATSFDALPLGENVRRALDEMGFVSPTPVQIATYQPVATKKDVVVQARTGTGKTAAFGIPLIDKVVRPDPVVQVLILAPTRELALQSARELSRIGKYAGLQTAAIYGGAPFDRQVRQLRKGAQIVSGTPGRVLDHLNRRTLDPSSIRVLILDEADEMLSMGFVRELTAIMEALPTDRQTLLFSATIDAAVQRLATRMRDPELILLSGDRVGAEGIAHYVYTISGQGRDQDLVKIIEIENPESALVFCNTKIATESVAFVLRQAGFDADWLNGDLPQSDREKVMDRTRRGELRFLVATDVAARGIDVSHLTHVINYGFPESVEQYIHRTGRTGRAGRTGTAISLVSPQELGTLYYLRLQYKIFPIERTLPSEGEQRTRQEVDRIGLLAEAFPKAPTEIDLAVARRLLTHTRAEGILSGLLNAFFGSRGDDVDEQAAAARRSRPPPLPAPSDSTPAATRPATPGDESTARSGGEDGVTNGADSDSSSPRAVGGSDRPLLFLNVGRRDGVRPGDIAKLIRDSADLARSDIGRIRVRDKHTLVQIDPEDIDRVIEALRGRVLGEREIVAERSKGSR